MTDGVEKPYIVVRVIAWRLWTSFQLWNDALSTVE
jgi:hypothetical protein